MSPRVLSTLLLPTILTLCCLHNFGCVGSIVETGEATGNNTGADAGAAAACVPQGTASNSGFHKPGQACLQCHGNGEGPAFTLAGTVYDGINSDVPMAGVAVLLTDANGVELTLVTAENGNFWTNQALAFPVMTSSTRCPTSNPMFTPVKTADADCNSAGCHTAGFRVHAQ